jgi:CheY-like chemotaxis protein
VSDDGIGIPERHHALIFEAFQRAGQETGPIEGTGIGLAICKRLADAMDGKVGFRSVEGKGSTFWLELPTHVARESKMALKRDTVRPEAADSGELQKVVYVEDNPSNIALMEAFVTDYEGVELIVATNAELGLELIRSHRPVLVVMDLHLPGMSGFAATEHLKADPETAAIPVVALSAAVMPQDRKRAEGLGFHSFLTKPMEVDKLAEVFDALLR